MARKILLGFNDPKSLEEDIIYVTFEHCKRGVAASEIEARAISNKRFYSHLPERAGRQLQHEEQAQSAISVSLGYASTSYIEFVNDLKKCNKEKVDYSNLLKEGADAYHTLSKLEQTIKDSKK